MLAPPLVQACLTAYLCLQLDFPKRIAKLKLTKIAKLEVLFWTYRGPPPSTPPKKEAKKDTILRRQENLHLHLGNDSKTRREAQRGPGDRNDSRIKNAPPQRQQNTKRAPATTAQKQRQNRKDSYHPYIYIYIYTYTYIHTHTHIYIYIYGARPMYLPFLCSSLPLLI